VLDGADAERAAATRAVVFTLCCARTWQAMRDEGGLDGAAAGRAVAHAISSSSTTPRPPRRSHEHHHPTSSHARVPTGGGEAFHILDGTLIILGADGNETPAAPGDTVIVATNAPHSYRNPGPDDARCLVTLAPGGFESSSPSSQTPPRLSRCLAPDTEPGDAR
jgi:hypothetical protein